MTAFAALVRREFLEHRGAFLLAPAALVLALLLAVLLAGTTQRAELAALGLLSTNPLRLFEYGFVAFAVLWWLYLLGVVFFYCADGFSADRRDNAMLFWKSMPRSDFTVLGAKFAAATTLFPALVLVAALVSGLMAALVIYFLTTTGIGNTAAFLAALPGAYLQIALGLIVGLAAAILWYAPFLAWVGALATVVGRWAVPLSLLVPGLIVVLENVTFGIRLSGGRVWNYLAYRADFPVDEGYVEAWLLGSEPFSATAFTTDLLARLDWLQVLLGLAVALALLFLAAQYRRRVVQ